MAWTNPLLNVTVFSLGCCLELAIAASASAQSIEPFGNPTSNSNPHQTWMVSRFNPPDRGAPGAAVGGATRRPGESCDAQLAEQITPLVPKDNKNSYFGLTVAERPTFFWHSQGNPEKPVTFFLYEVNGQHQSDQPLYETPLNLPNSPGIVSLTLPPDRPLETGKSYIWYLEMRCSEADEDLGLIVGGIDRVAPSSNFDLNLSFARTPSAQSKLYAESGIWFDSLDTLARARLIEDTPDLAANWEALLQDDNVQLGNFASEPFIDCCRVEAANREEPRLTTQN
jgi:Domain of Unknown Function (DUF928)